MKLFIEVELSPDELPVVTELFRTLRILTDQVKTRDLVKLLQFLISRVEDESQLNIVAAEISDLILADMASETVFVDLLTAFTKVIFNPELVLRQKSVVPFMLILPRLSEPVKSHLCSLLIPKVLKHLTVKRPLDADRMEFFVQAETFAALVNLEFIPVTGAASTITSLLQKPETRSAAITMLGKTVELCQQQLNEKCDPAVLAELRSGLQGITEDIFQYDVTYIKESMGWTFQMQPIVKLDRTTAQCQADSSQKARVDTALKLERLYAVDSYHGHHNTIFALCFDNKRDQIVSGGKDGMLFIWSTDGQVLERLTMARHYACSMDISPYHQALLVCGVAKEEPAAQVGIWIPPPPSIFQYGPVGRSWRELSVLSKDSSKLVSCIKALGGTEHAFITGETICSAAESGVQKLGERVCYYDMHSASSFTALQPVRQYAEHEDLITCISLLPQNQNIFMSGSRDCTLRVWDRRVDRSIGMFGASGMAGRLQAHDGMVTCIDASETNMILSAGMDGHVHRWDFRTLADQVGHTPLSSLHIDDSAVLKIALGDLSSKAAVSTLHGLYLVDFFNPRPVARMAEPFSDGRRIGRYHDLKWATGNSILYAAGDDMRIDSYALR